MPDFTYDGPADKEYPFLAGAVNPVPGESYSLKEAPNDGYWRSKGSRKPAKTARPRARKAAAAAPEPAVPDVPEPEVPAPDAAPEPADSTKES